MRQEATNYPGIAARIHDSRKHGVGFDRYFVLDYRFDGKRYREGLGWASQGWTAKKAFLLLSELKENQKTGTGPKTLQEKRDQEKETREKAQAHEDQEAKENITYGQFFKETYFPHAQADKSEKSWEREETFHRLWVAPVIGKKPLKAVAQLDLERIKKNLADKGRTPRTVHYCLAVIRQVFNFAISTGVLNGKNPVASVKKPKVDNRRLRFLTRHEAEELMQDLAKRSKSLYDIALVSLRCGLRAGEVFSLEWGDVDLERELLTLRDTKSGKNRVAYMTQDVLEMLKEKFKDQGPGELVFPDRNGKKRLAISKSFREAVKELGFNNGVTDKRQSVCFHSLRHTFASWLVENGTDLYTVKELLGHSTIAMTERYSHLAPNSMRSAIKGLEQSLSRGKVLKIDQERQAGNK
jgi:integrase